MMLFLLEMFLVLIHSSFLSKLLRSIHGPAHPKRSLGDDRGKKTVMVHTQRDVFSEVHACSRGISLASCFAWHTRPDRGSKLSEEARDSLKYSPHVAHSSIF